MPGTKLNDPPVLMRTERAESMAAQERRMDGRQVMVELMPMMRAMSAAKWVHVVAVRELLRWKVWRWPQERMVRCVTWRLRRWEATHV